MPRKKRTPLDRTSSLNKYVICNRCDKRFPNKHQLISHNCISLKNQFTCKWCNVIFKSRACLASHATHVHGDMCYRQVSQKPPSELLRCDGCSKLFAEVFQLQLHIRRTHFNLKAKVPYWLQKRVNQVWFEKVHNSNNVMEIRKAGPNVLVMRKLDDNTAIKVADHDTEHIDLTDIYPCGPRYKATQCKICKKQYDQRSLKKHMDEVHYKKVRHRCNKCNLAFKRLYLYLKHSCDAYRKPRGVRQTRGAWGRIARVESLARKEW